jgi:hypothetical protein
MLQCAEAYLNETIISQTRNADLAIGTGESSESWHYSRVEVNGSGISTPRGSHSGNWTSFRSIRPVCAVESQTGGRLPKLVANTTFNQAFQGIIDEIVQPLASHEQCLHVPK